MSDRPRAHRLVDEVRRFGLMSAATVAERYTGALSGVAAGDYAETAARFGQAYLTLLDQILVGSAETVERVTLTAVAPGAVSRATIWVHNASNRPDPGAGVVVSQFAGVVGSIPHHAVEFPERTPEMAPDSSRQISVSVDVPPGQAPGDYHAVMTVSTAPDTPLVLHLRVRR